MPRINTNIKILTAILLAGFILSNIALLSLAAESLVCPDNSLASLDPITGKFTCAKEKPVEKEKTTSSFDVEISGEKPTISRDETTFKTTFGEVTQEVRAYKFSVPIPCQPGFGGFKEATCPSASAGPAQYIARLYQFSLMIAGLAAFGAIVFGSLKYILSAGNIGSTEEARDIIVQAIYGLALLLGASLILYTINPQLVNLINPVVTPLNIDTITGRGTTTEEQDGSGNLTSVSGGLHPLCQSGINTNVLGITFHSSTCLACKANAIKSSASDCVCAPNFKPNAEGNQCVPEKNS